MQEKISIIIPVYNVAPLIGQCLDSLLKQTHTNLEIICVNDGSTDNSLEILNQYKEKDTRIIVIDIENQGVSNARNVGLQQATGEFVSFVDSDDWVALNYCETLYKVAKQENADIVMCTYMREYEHSSFPTYIFNKDYIVWDREKMLQNIHRRLFGLINEELKNPEKGDSVASLWTKFIRRDIALKGKFTDLKEIGTFEDGLYQIEILPFCNRFVYINEPLYHYRKTNTNSITSKYKDNLFAQWQNLYTILGRAIIKNEYEDMYQIALNNRICLSMIGLGLNEIAAKKNIFKKSKQLKQILLTERYKEAFHHLSFVYFPFKWKVFFTLCKKRWTFLLTVLLNIISKLKRRKAQ